MKRVASRGSYIRSAARATFSAYRSVPVRWRLAGGSAALTFVILAAFAAGVGVVTNNQLRGQFDEQVHSAADQLRDEIAPLRWQDNGALGCNKTVSLTDYVATEHAQIRIYDEDGNLQCTQDQVRIKGQKPPLEKPTFTPPTTQGVVQELGYRIVVPRKLSTLPKGTGNVWLMYAVPLSDLDHTLARVRLFLFLGVLGGIERRDIVRAGSGPGIGHHPTVPASNSEHCDERHPPKVLLRSRSNS